MGCGKWDVYRFQRNDKWGVANETCTDSSGMTSGGVANETCTDSSGMTNGVWQMGRVRIPAEWQMGRDKWDVYRFLRSIKITNSN